MKKNFIISNYLYILRKLLLRNKHACIFAILMIVVEFVVILDVLFPKVLLGILLKSPISISNVVLTIVIFFLFSTLARGAQSFFIKRNNVYLTNMGFVLKEDIQYRAMTMDYADTEDKNVLNRMNCAYTCANRAKIIVEKCCSILSAAIILVVFSVFLIQLNAILLLILAVNIFIAYKALEKVKAYENSLRDERANVKRRKHYLFKTMYDYSYGKEMRVFNMLGMMTNKFREQTLLNKRLGSDIERKKFWFNIVESGLTFLREALVYGVLLYLFFTGSIKPDDFVMYLGVVTYFSVTAKRMIEDCGILLEIKGYVADYRQFVDHKDEKSDILLPECKPESFTITFEHVFFQYPGSDNFVLQDLNFEIKDGSHVALVGLNGSGKSTIVKLICRFYTPTKGRICLNGIDISTYDKQEYLSIISAVFQESKLFAFTLAENISLDIQNHDKEKLWDIFTCIGIDKTVNKLKNKENSNVLKNLYDDGVEFSGGERQLLYMARAMYKDAGILLLDEPTAALDALMEKKIYEQFSQISKGRSTLFISHRLNSNRLCDKVLFLDNGHIVAQGNHEYLMDTCEAYKNLYNMQAQYYVEAVSETI